MMVRTTVVGSWPPPFGQRPALRPFWRGEVSEDDPHVEAALVAAARIAMDEMMACGLDQIMGGEVFAPDFVHTVPPRLEGLEAESLRDIAKGQSGVARYRITGPVSAPRGTGHAKAFRREQAIEPRLDKAAVPTPLTMALSFPNDPALDTHVDDLVSVVSAEVSDMGAAGASEIQLDAPSEAIACAHGTRPVAELADLMCRPFEEADGIEGVTRTVHFCLGDIARKPSTQVQNLRSLVPLLQACEGRIDRAHLECSYAGQWDDRSLLAEVPSSIEIVAGIADVKSSPAPVDHYVGQIDELLAVVGEDRLLVSS
ncbi:MAG: hypothetical protein GY724_11885, partial [Actinomycetia bacterium]|nr:hypothetical protein [Actinomycetes bacterium]